MASPENSGAGPADPVPPVAPSETTPLLGETQPSAQAADEADTPETSRWSRIFKSIGRRLAAVGVDRFVAAALVVAFAIVVVLWYKSSKANSTAALCLTPACVHAASGYLSNFSPNYKNIDPCTNFEEFVCGGWQESHDLRADQGKASALSAINDEVTSIIKKILEGGYPGASSHSTFSPQNLEAAHVSVDQQNFEELQEAYNACLNVDAITKRGIAPITNLIDGLAATFGKDDYSETILYLQRLGVDSLFSLSVGDDDKNPQQQVIAVAPGLDFGLPSKTYYEDAELVAKYQETISSVLGAIKPKVANIGATSKDAAALIELESKLSHLAPSRADLFDVTKTYNPLPIKDAAKLLPQFSIERVLKQLIPSDYTPDIANVIFPDVLANISLVVSETPVDVLHNFFYWRIVLEFGDVVLGPEIKPLTQFENVLQGKDPSAEAERWRTCTASLSGSLRWILSRFFIEAAFSGAAKDFGNQIIADIKEAYLKRIDTLEWMDDEVKKVAAEKVRNIDQKVGYPTASPNITNPDELKAYYADVTISGAHFDNVLSASRFAVKREWASLGKPTDFNEWGMSAATVNAYYNPPHNEIVFPAAIMQFPLFSVDLPSYVSYGAFGAVAGHELSHAFDNNGRHYDVHGRYDNWWTDATIAAFAERAQCIVDEFSNFTVQDKNGKPVHINGELTEGENIADSGGISAAWNAWHARRGKEPRSKKELSLPGLDDFTHEQLFYVSYANAWCAKFRPEALVQQVQTNEHSPDPIRIRGTVANSRGFREAFNCPVKEPTCELW